MVVVGWGGLLFSCGMWLLFLLLWSAPLKLYLGWLLLGILWSCIRGLGAHFELLSLALAHTCINYADLWWCETMQAATRTRVKTTEQSSRA